MAAGRRILACLALSLTLLAPLASAQDALTILQNNGLTYLITALETANLTDVAHQAEAFTLFAPTNQVRARGTPFDLPAPRPLIR